MIVTAASGTSAPVASLTSPVIVAVVDVWLHPPCNPSPSTNKARKAPFQIRVATPVKKTTVLDFESILPHPLPQIWIAQPTLMRNGLELLKQPTIPEIYARF
jgi:hypothetical protein